MVSLIVQMALMKDSSSPKPSARQRPDEDWAVVIGPRKFESRLQRLVKLFGGCLQECADLAAEVGRASAVQVVARFFGGDRKTGRFNQSFSICRFDGNRVRVKRDANRVRKRDVYPSIDSGIRNSGRIPDSQNNFDLIVNYLLLQKKQHQIVSNRIFLD